MPITINNSRYSNVLSTVGAIDTTVASSIYDTHAKASGGRAGLLDNCELEIKVEPVECIAGSPSSFLKIADPSDPSLTLNAALADNESDASDTTATSAVLAGRSLEENISYFSNIVRKLPMGTWSYNILKVSYKSPCDLAALSFKLDIPGTHAVCPIGVYSTSEGVVTGAAHGKMTSITAMSFDNSPVPISDTNLCFFQKDEANSCPASSDWSTFCYLLVLTTNGNGKLSIDVCLDGNQVVSDTRGFANEFVAPSIDLTQTQLYTSIAYSAGGVMTPELWYSYLGYQALFVMNLLMLPNEQTEEVRQAVISNMDYDLNGEVDAGDALSIFRLIKAVQRGETLSASSLPNNVAKPCCEDIEEIPTRTGFECQAEIEIINVQCGGEIVNKASSYSKTHSTGNVITMSEEGATETAENGGCDDVSDGQDDVGTGSMIVDIRIMNSATVSGLQFDVGFNKFSTADDSHISIQTNPTLVSKGWRTAHKVCDDRFGYDKLVRVISFQALGANHYPNGYNALDDSWHAEAHQVDSIQPNSRGDGMTVVRLVVANAPKTTCACPSKSYYISRPLSSIKSLNSDQISHPERYEVGKEWHGPVIYSQGTWWTASIFGGEPMRDGSSVPLLVEWNGIKLLNKRVVSNQDLYVPEHEKYGADYYGHYSGFLADIPQSFEDYISFYDSQIGTYVVKALHNGLDLGYNRERSTYNYLWQISLLSIFRYVDRLRTDAGTALLTEDEKRTIVNQFLEKDYKGYIDDANLDGKFDVADIVALYNSARMRYYGLDNKSSSDWRAAPGKEWNWVLTSAQQSKDIYSTYSYPVDASYTFPDKPMFQDFTNLQKVVPAYCQNTICTSTMSDICPDICGNMDYETEETIKNSAGSFSLIGFGERTDIKPNANAELRLTFSEQPADNSFIILQDFNDTKNTFVFVPNGSATSGDLLTGGGIAVEKGTTLRATVIELGLTVDSVSDFQIVTDSTFDNDNSTVTTSFVQRADGEIGNTPVVYSEDLYSSLVNYTNRFVNGTNYYSTLPNSFRGWHEYFYDIYNIKTSDLYRNEVKYGGDGASFIPLELRVTSDRKKLTEALSFVSWSWTTLDFCDAYHNFDSQQPKIKVLPGDGFTMCEVFDAISGARLSPITAAEFYNFYQLPSHGKISILSHNFREVGGVEEYHERPSLDNSDRYAPITMDGGKLITAKMFLTPMPNWSDESSVKILDNHNDALNESMSAISTSFAPMEKAIEIANTTKGSLSVGPKTSEYSQNYAQDSASLLTDAEYTLHAEIINPRTVLIKYNTMRPFTYASFSIRAHKGSSEIESVYAPPSGLFGNYEGWQFSHHFNQNTQTNIDGLPLLSSQYATDGYSVVTVAPTGQVDAPDKTIYGVANPRNFSGMGDLCFIRFKEDICGQLPIFGKRYICPPIGERNFDYPQKGADTVSDNTSRPIDNKYPEGSFEDQKYNKTTSGTYEKNIIANYDSASNQDGKMVLDANNKLDIWYSIPFGQELEPFLLDDLHRPEYSKDESDTRNSLFFDTTNGMTTSPNASVEQISANKWSAYCAVKPHDVDASIGPMTIFMAGDVVQGNSGDNAPRLKLCLEHIQHDQFRVVATVDDGEGNSHDLSYVASPSDFAGWHVFSWVGDLSTFSSYLYMDGNLVASSESMLTIDNTFAETFTVHVGHNGNPNHNNISTAHSESFHGRIGQIVMFNEVHDSQYRQKAEAFLALKYDTQSYLPSEHVGYKDEETQSGLTDSGYLSLNKTDNLAGAARLMAQGKSGGSITAQDLGSDRCAAAWVSKHICLDKDNQTLIAKKCGRNIGNVAAQFNGGGGGQFTLSP